MAEDREGKPAEKAPGRLRQILAPNPSPMTGRGTTTFLLGRGDVVVVDPGPDDPRHLSALLSATAGEKVAAILVTHPHLDHSALAPVLAKATGAPVLAFGRAGSGRSDRMRLLADQGLSDGGEGVDHAFTPDILLREAGPIVLGGLHFEVVPTPGHMGEHLAFGWEGELFSGDHVMAWAPSLVSPPDGDMGAYLASLDRLATDTRWTRLRPAHGAVIDDPARRIRELVEHRRGREAQVLAALAESPADLAGVAARVYRDLAPALIPAARRNALAHLIDLIERNLVSAKPWPSPSAIFRLA